MLFTLLISQWCLSQNYTEYVTGNTNDVNTSHEFGICLMGGATESDDAMRWFLQKAQGGDVVVLRASGSDGYNNYFYSELGITINSVRSIVINNAAGAIDPYVLDKVAKAEAIWFAGGDQFNYVSYFKNNTLEDALNTFINTKQGVIGGTSAGMAILGNYYFDAANGTVTSATALNDPYDPKVSLGYNDFLEIPFLEDVITDSHYDDPDRRGRHSVFMARFAQDNGARSFGIACDEYTAVCVEADGTAHVYGEYPTYDDFAYFIQANCVANYAPEDCSSEQPLHWVGTNDALKVYKVGGTVNGENFFDISDWENASGGEWQNWYVQNGNLMTSAATNPQCGTLSLEEIETVDIDIYPNPFSNVINISSNNFEFEAQLFDVNGKELLVYFNAYNQINTQDLAIGIYFLKLDIGDGQKTFKIVKE